MTWLKATVRSGPESAPWGRSWGWAKENLEMAGNNLGDLGIW